MKNKLKKLLKENLNDRQRRILIIKECLEIDDILQISNITGISINHIYSELKKIKYLVRTKDQVPSTYPVPEKDSAIIYNNISKSVNDTSNTSVSIAESISENISQHKYNDRYLDIWEIYPKKTDKRSGERKFLLLLKKYSVEFLKGCVMNYLDSVRDREPDYIKSLAVFFGRDQHYLEYSEKEDEHMKVMDSEPDNSLKNLLN